MARNCSSCGDADSCSCAIIGGTNTTVTGAGTGANPFSISSTNPPVVGLTNGLLSLTTSGTNNHTVSPSITPGTNGQVLTTDATGTVVWALPTAAAFASNDTNCIDFSGLGTVADPLTADLILDPAGNLECTAAGLRVEPSPNVGDVLTTSAVGVVTWEPGGGSFSIVGQDLVTEVVNAGDTITFVGTNGITVDVSATDTVNVSLDLCDAVFPPTLIGNDGVLVPGNAPNCVRTLVNDVRCGVLAGTINGVEFVPISAYLEVFQDVFTPAVGDTVVNATDTPILRVYRNGLIQIEGVDYTVAGTAVTFTVPFGNSGGGAGLETVVLEEPVCSVL